MTGEDAGESLDYPRFSLRRLRAALARRRAAERAMADEAAKREGVVRVGTNWQLPDGTWIHGRPPSGGRG